MANRFRPDHIGSNLGLKSFSFGQCVPGIAEEIAQPERRLDACFVVDGRWPAARLSQAFVG